MESDLCVERTHLRVRCSPRGERPGRAYEEETVRDVFHSDCPARHVLGHLTGRWTVLVLAALQPGPRRYHELRRTIEGISDKMLTATLRTLVDDNLLTRT